MFASLSRISIKRVLNELKTSRQSITIGGKENHPNKTRRKARVKEFIVKIHEESYQIYSAPKITEVFQTNGHKIVQQTVSKYMNEEVTVSSVI